ncbi:MAG: clostripain-related cysteine peptidase, partial [Candidatus Rifleibacteriota bacterium]
FQETKMPERKISGLFLLVALFFSFNTAAFAINDYTLMIYMVNDDKDHKLEKANFRRLSEMKRYGAGDTNEIVVLMDGVRTGSSSEDKLDYRGASRLLIKKGNIYDAGVLGEANMGDPYVLWNFLKWTKENHPAKNYILVINSHGSGVFSWNGEGSTSSSIPGTVVFNPDRPQRKRQGRFVAYDHTNKDCLTVFEIKEVLRAFKEKLNNNMPLDIIVFDACMPASIETLYQLRDVCSYFIGSPETTPMTGFAYDDMVRELKHNPDNATEVYAEKVAYMQNNNLIGAWKTSGAKQIAFALNNLSMELINAINETGKNFKLSQLAAFGGGTKYWDLIKIAKSFYKENSNLHGASNAAIIKQLGYELYEAIKQARLSSTGSLSIVWPDDSDYKRYQKFYKALDLSLDQKWDELLDNWIQ